MSGGSSANNSWTILTPEETVAETLRPLAEGKEHHEESLTSAAAVFDEAGSGQNQPAHSAESADGHLVSEEKRSELSGDTSAEQHTSVPTAAPVPTSLEVSGSFVPGSDALSQSEGLPEGPAQSGPDPDSFSDSYTHITPSPDEPPASLLSTETLGGVEFTREEETLTQEATLHPLNGEELQYEGEDSDLFPRTTDLGKQAVYLVDQLVMELFSIWARRSGEAVVDSPVDSEVGEERTEKTGEEAEPEVRRRRSLLAALERIGRAEEEEEREEEFQLPQREEDSGFSVNKCMLGAVILLGLGAIFLSGVFMDLDEESDYGTMELKDAEAPGKQEWLNPEVPPPPVDADSAELLNKLAKGNQQISVLQAQLQAQKEELKVSVGQAAEGAKERLRREEVEKENSRLKKEMTSLPVLQKENERMKRELESVPALHKELETLRSTVTELRLPSASEVAQAPATLTTAPSSGQPEDSTQGTAGSTERQPKKPWDDQREKKKDVKKDKSGKKEGKENSEWKEGEKKEHKDGGKSEWKKGKHEQGKFEKEKDKEGTIRKPSDETKQWKEKEWKKEKASRGDEGKPWKDREEKKEWIEKSERKEGKEEKDWKKAKHEKVKEGKQWKGKEENKDWKLGKDHGEKHKGKEEWKREKEWTKGKDGVKESGKEEKKEWKKKEGDCKSKSKDHSKEGKGKGERKQWEERKNQDRKEERTQRSENKGKSKDDKEWGRKDEKKQWEKREEPWKRGGEKDKKHNGDRKKDESGSQKHKVEHKSNGNRGHKEEHLWGDGKPPHTHSRPSLEQPEYWVQQRDRLQRNHKPPKQCNSLETCAEAEGLLPVPLVEFEAILQTYLAKAEKAGVDVSKREELKKLAGEFFKDGVFVHDQTSFQEFVEDLEDILEDMVEGDDEDEDSALEEEMEEFEREVMKKFSVPRAVEEEERSRGEGRKESGQGRG
ncbi:pre-B-cell leukemia homeobox interacting protein 1b isoform X2 [Cottoperca gobio]|uniref:Pre-B-cell leukemia homeobox interacting protein 1b isoform X2 n=1 Tax=Cottoperca gobio TaxID=56716 RepID=A0A6J2R9V4_COTGO|nr:pre-B-cell leukemia transcription factor-interacting protein 1 isoform X2 [Cottoperca gobio]